MKRERAISKAIFWMREEELLPEDPVKVHRIKEYINWVAIIAEEERIKTLTAHNNKEIAHYNRSGKLIKTYKSIKKAATALGLNRDVIDDSLSGRTKFTRKHGYYFRYIKDGTTEDIG